MKQSEREPWRAGSALKLGASMTVNCGSMLGPLGRIVLGQEHVAGKQVVPGELVDDPDRQADTRDPRRPTRPGRTAPYPADEARQDRGAGRRTAASSMPRLTSPQLMCRSLDGSRTKNLSFGDRPVCVPVRPTSGLRRRAAFVAAGRPLVRSTGVLRVPVPYRTDRRMPTASSPAHVQLELAILKNLRW